VDLAHGLVEKGVHFEMGSLWSKLNGHKVAQQVKKALHDMGEDSSTELDLAVAHQDLLKRGFSKEVLEGEMLQRILELSKNLS